MNIGLQKKSGGREWSMERELPVQRPWGRSMPAVVRGARGDMWLE